MAFEGHRRLAEVDPEVTELIAQETQRQTQGIELIASENFTSGAVLEALGSVFTNKYAEGTVGRRYYGGTDVVDRLETLCQQRALAAFRLSGEEWGVNVQPYSGSPANLAVYTALLKPHDRVMGLDLPSGGHLTHGFQNGDKKISATSIFFETMPYRVGADGLIDYDALAASAALFRPKMLICGYSAYPRDLDYARFRAIADSVGAFLVCDMAHYSGLVVGGQVASPFAHCDVVTSTTHKTLRGPRAGMIFFRRTGALGDLGDRINQAVFPALQGGPHEHQIAALAVALKEAAQPAFQKYAADVVANARRLAAELQARGYTVVTGGTDNHIVLWNVRAEGLTGSKCERVFELAHISANKNSIFGDKSMFATGGIRLGSSAMTTRGLSGDDFAEVAALLDRGVKIAKRVQEEHGKLLKVFNPAVEKDEGLRLLAKDVIEFASKFPLPKKNF